MKILNQTKVGELKHLTKLQHETLIAGGLETLGDILYFQPARLDVISPITTELKPKTKYIAEFEVINVVRRKSNRGVPYLWLLLKCGQRNFQAFLFSRASFIINKIFAGKKYIFTVSSFGSNLNIHKVQFLDSKIDLDGLNKTKIEIFYPKLNTKIDTTFLRRVHSRLKPEDYIVNLESLAPFELLNSQTLDIFSLHHPANLEQYLKCRQNLVTLQVFLRTSLQKYLVKITTENQFAWSPKLNLNWLQAAVPKLPVTLTSSQKRAIWDIVKDITYGYEE